MTFTFDPRLAVLAVSALVMLWAMISDMRALRIPNSCALATLVLAIVYGALSPGYDWLNHAGAFVVLFAICFVLFHFNLLGGGDVKLISAMGFWLGFAHLLPFLLMMTVAGAALAVFLAVIKALRGRSKAGGTENTEGWRKQAMPYGVAIAFAGLVYFATLANGLLNPA